MLKIGLEKEYWCKDLSGAVCHVPKLVPYDSCGYLAEARGKPYSSVEEAVYSLKAEEYRIDKIIEANGLILCDNPIEKLSRSFLLKNARTHAKGLVSFENYLGHENHKLRYNQGERGAGVHVTFSDEKKYQSAYDGKGEADLFYYQNFDWVSIFRKLDVAFKDEIKTAKRLPGFYEVKGNGLVEYRSLPSNVDLLKLIDVLNGILNRR